MSAAPRPLPATSFRHRLTRPAGIREIFAWITLCSRATISWRDFRFPINRNRAKGAFIYSPQESLYNTRNAVLSDTQIVNPRVVNEFRFGYNRSNSNQVPLKIAISTAFAAQNGLQFGPVIGLPSVNFNFTGETLGPTQFSGFGAASSTLNFENSFQWADHVSIIRGNHTLKTGGEARRFRFDQLPGFPMNGSYYFGAIFTGNPSLTQASGLPYADFLLGFPATVTSSSPIDF